MESSGLHYCLFVKVQARQDFVRYDVESLLSQNHFRAKDYCATAHNEQILFASWPCDMMVSHQTEKEGFEPSRRY